VRLIFASALLLFPLHAQAAPSVPNDCWSGVLTFGDKAHQAQLVATGPVAQWRVGTSLVVYPTKENYDFARIDAHALAEKAYDTSRPITVIPTWISGPKPGDNESVEVMMKYRTAEAETGTIVLTYWTLSGRESLPPDIVQFLHDISCRGIP
jgi:hypothetical protein